MGRVHAAAAVLASVILLTGTVAHAALVNFGVDIKSSRSTPYTQVTGGYTGAASQGGNDGKELEDDDVLSFVIETAGLGQATINGFELFIDAEDLDCEGNCATGDADDDTRFKVFLFDASEALAGYLSDVSRHSTHVPVLDGEFGGRTKTPYDHDADNSFFNYSSGDAFTKLAALIGAGSIGVKIQGVGHNDTIRVDGANLQVNYAPYVAPQEPQRPEAPATSVPEGGSLLSFAASVLLVARFRRNG